MTARHREPSIEEKGLRTHVESLGVTWDTLVLLFDAKVSNSAAARALGKNPKTIKVWRELYERGK